MLWWYCVVFGGIFVVFGVTIAIFLLLVSSFFPGHMWSCLCAAQTNVHPPHASTWLSLQKIKSATV